MSRALRNRLTVLLAIAALAATACGGGDDDSADDVRTTAARGDTADDRPATTDSDDRPTTTRTRRGDEDPEETTTAAPEEPDGPDLVCTSPAPTEIALGSQVSGEITGNDSEACYWLEVPEGLDSLSFDLSGVSANIQLGIGYGYVWNIQYPGSGRYWFVRPGDDPAGSVTVENPDPGPYFLRVSPNRPRAATPFDLLVSSTPEMNTKPTGGALASDTMCERPATEIALGAEIEGEFVTFSLQNEPRRYYCVMVPEGTGSLTVELTTGGSILVGVFQPSTFSTQTVGSSFDGSLELTVEVPPAGPSYIVLTNDGFDSGARFTFTVETG